ncbi:PaaI family thioesterase [Nevskia sp.]|uniref:PaaI family thioesterase n=1 Tax=Nevskia sp. TaxID=1929292 RepID=UPI0025FAB9CF|nr:PaaI family thioesterase [Nevskia sp.]
MTLPHDTTAWAHFLKIAPYTARLGIEAVTADDGGCVLALPYRPEFVGDPDSGVLHGGAVTALIDTTFGFAVYFRIQEYRPMATLDLRIDYLRPAKPGVKVHTRAQCYKLTPELAFVRGCSYEDDAEDPFASCVGVFMFTAAQPAPAKAATVP